MQADWGAVCGHETQPATRNCIIWPFYSNAAEATIFLHGDL